MIGMFERPIDIEAIEYLEYFTFSSNQPKTVNDDDFYDKLPRSIRDKIKYCKVELDCRKIYFQFKNSWLENKKDINKAEIEVADIIDRIDNII